MHTTFYIKHKQIQIPTDDNKIMSERKEHYEKATPRFGWVDRHCRK